MNKIIAFLLIITPVFTYGMQELKTAAGYETRSLSNVKDNRQPSMSYREFLQKAKKRCLIVNPPTERTYGTIYRENGSFENIYTGGSTALWGLYNESYEETSQGNICTNTQQNFKSTTPQLERSVSFVEKH